jgi:hypothetical protein
LSLSCPPMDVEPLPDDPALWLGLELWLFSEALAE